MEVRIEPRRQLQKKEGKQGELHEQEAFFRIEIVFSAHRLVSPFDVSR